MEDAGRDRGALERVVLLEDAGNPADRRAEHDADALRERGPDRVSPNFLPNVLVDSISGQLAITLGITGPNYAVVAASPTAWEPVAQAETTA